MLERRRASRVVKAAELSGASNVLFRRNSTTGAVEAVAVGRRRHRAERRPACQLSATGGGRRRLGAVRSSCWPARGRWSAVGSLLVRPRRRPAARPRGLPRPRSAAWSSTCPPSRPRTPRLIAAVGVRRGLPARAASIALATAYQESKLRNLDHGDRDSLGLFQQRPSQGWGTAAQIQDPYYAINAFYDALEKIDGYQTMRITEAAQEVQRSGFPEAYEDHAADGRALASALTGYSPGRLQLRGRRRASGIGAEGRAATASPRAPSGCAGDLQQAFGALPLGGFAPGGVSTGHMKGSAHYEGRALDVFVRPISAANKRTGWAIASYLVAHASRLGSTTSSSTSGSGPPAPARSRAGATTTRRAAPGDRGASSSTATTCTST